MYANTKVYKEGQIMNYNCISSISPMACSKRNAFDFFDFWFTLLTQSHVLCKIGINFLDDVPSNPNVSLGWNKPVRTKNNCSVKSKKKQIYECEKLQVFTPFYSFRCVLRVHNKKRNYNETNETSHQKK